MIPFIQLKKREKHPWGDVTFSKVKPATILKVELLQGCFSRLLNCTNGTKSCKTSHFPYEKKCLGEQIEVGYWYGSALKLSPNL